MQQDTKLLENRIKMLQKEEDRILKKIDSTRHRASQIHALKSRNEEEFLKKLQSKKSLNKDLKVKKARIREMRMEGLLHIESNRNHIIGYNHDSFVHTKEEQVINEEQSRLFKENIKKYNYETKRKYIVEGEERTRKKLVEIEHGKKIRAEEDYQYRLLGENLRMNDMEQRIVRME